MGNQLSADREKEKEKERLEKEKAERDRLEKERLEKQAAMGPVASVTGGGGAAVKVERTRSRTISSATTCPPTETKINANAEQPIIPLDRPVSSVPTTPLMAPTTPIVERRSGKSPAAKEVISATKNLNLKELPRPTLDEIRKEAAEMEATPKFETVRPPSETSVLDEEDLKEIDEGISSFSRVEFDGRYCAIDSGLE